MGSSAIAHPDAADGDEASTAPTRLLFLDRPPAYAAGRRTGAWRGEEPGPAAFEYVFQHLVERMSLDQVKRQHAVGHAGAPARCRR